MDQTFDSKTLDLALESLEIRLAENHASPVEIVVCGGSALILTEMVPRTTKDVDVVAMIRGGVLSSPDPLPDDLRLASTEVAEDLGLAPDWLNNGPSKGEGGLFQMGLPFGFAQRLLSRRYGAHLTVHFIARVDQIHFKLYAAVDRGGYHVEDLQALNPSPDELTAAARWAMTHDVSEGFAMVVKRLLRNLGYEDVAERL
jgi:hypothetical protein